MDKSSTSNQPHPEGEPKITSGTPAETWPVDIPGGRFQYQFVYHLKYQVYLPDREELRRELENTLQITVQTPD